MATRRDVLRLASLTTAAVTLPLPSWSRSFEAPPAAGALLSRCQLSLLIGDWFLAESPAGRTVELLLVEIADTPSAVLAGTAGRDDCFVAVFESSERRLEQGTYAVSSPGTGVMEIFLVPAPSADPERSCLLATINRAVF
jgi:hypothetical protein